MPRVGAESGATILHASGARRFMVLAGLLLGTWIVMLVITSGVGSASVELGDMLRAAGAPPSSTNQPGHVEQFLVQWKDAVLGVLEVYRFRPSTSVMPFMLLWITTIAALLSALAMLAPLVGTGRNAGSGLPLTWSIVGGSVLGGGLGVGVMMVVIDIPRIIARWTDNQDPFSNAQPTAIIPIGICVWILTGGLWSAAFRSGGRGHASSRIARQVRWLFAGSCVELALAAPTFAAAARRDSCYCAWASWFSIILGTMVLTVLCGPMLVLLWTREARLRWIRGACESCGYLVRTGSTVCPECGAVRKVPSQAPGHAIPEP